MSNNKDQENILPENFKRAIKSINLIPDLTKAETVVVKTKNKINVSAAISLLIFFVFTLIIVGFNIFAKVSLNTSKDKLYGIENDLKLSENTLISNDEILRRILLFKNIEKNTYSTKSVIVYMETLSKGLATIDTFELTNGTNFILAGYSPTLTDISKFWYVLGNDSFIKTINLKGVTKDVQRSRFTFEGELNVSEFIKQAQNNGTEN